MKNKELIYGIDFGTSNSAIAVCDDSGQSNVLRIGNNSGKTIHSAIFFPRGTGSQTFIGDSAINEYIDSGAKGRFLQSVKTILPDTSFSGTEIQGFGLMKAEDLISMIIRYIKEKADSLLGREIDRVVLGRPASFSKDPEADAIAEKRLFLAAQKAGFKEISFQLEPIAAALHYESQLINEEKVVLVADIGGGTSDFTLMKLSPDRAKKTDRKDDILSSNGIYIGGNSFDSDIMHNKLIKYFGEGTELTFLNSKTPFPIHILSGISQWENIFFMKSRRMRNDLTKYIRISNDPESIRRLEALIFEDLGYFLFSEIERTKILLSQKLEAEINFDHSIICIREMLTRQNFEDFINEKIQKITGTVEETLRLAGLRPGDVDTVFMTGGSSFIPAVKNIFSIKFGANKIASSDFFTSVVSGLALSSRLLF